MRRRDFLRGLVALPVVAALAPLLPKVAPVPLYASKVMGATMRVSTSFAADLSTYDKVLREVYAPAFTRALQRETALLLLE